MKNLIRKILLIGAIMISTSAIYAQNYSNIDAHAKTAPRSVEKHINTLTDYLNQNTNSDLEKVRAYYVWLTDNIVYDTEVFFSNKPNTKSGNDYTLKSKKAVCQGYSKLFKAFCDYSNINCFVVSGYSKGYGYSKNRPLTTTDHAWNTVYVDNKWHLIDATWGAGYVDDKKEYVAKFDNKYFLSKPDYFVLKHLPADPMWQLLSCTISITDYKKDDDTIVSKTKNCPYKYNFNDTITAYLKLNTVQQQMESAKRAFNFNPNNVEAPGFALLNTAYTMGNQLTEVYKNEEYAKALSLNREILKINEQAYSYLKKSKTQQGKSAANICKQNIASSKDNIKSLEKILK